MRLLAGTAAADVFTQGDVWYVRSRSHVFTRIDCITDRSDRALEEIFRVAHLQLYKLPVDPPRDPVEWRFIQDEFDTASNAPSSDKSPAQFEADAATRGTLPYVESTAELTDIEAKGRA
jgi:hypothetical protein